MNVENVAAIVTGGSSGLGSAVASALAAIGGRVTILDLNEEAGEERARSIGGRFAKVDVADERQVARALEAAEAAQGVARILVNCAGIGISGRTVDRDGVSYSLDRFRKVVEVNLVGTFNVLSAFAARLSRAECIDEERGVIINTASTAAFEGQIGQVAYSASKAGIVGMTLPIARDLAQLSIRVATIAPGLFRTPILEPLPEAAIEALERSVPFPSRLGRPEEFALMVQSIIANPMLNGETVRLDGAMRMPPR